MVECNHCAAQSQRALGTAGLGDLCALFIKLLQGIEISCK